MSRSEEEEEKSRTAVVSEASLHETVVTSPTEGWVSKVDAGLAESSFEARYQRLEVLARGGMGQIQILRDQRVGREVAAKFIRDDYSLDTELRARFIREACLQGRLEHPAIVPVHDLGVSSSGQLYFTMKLVRGVTLKDVIKKIRDRDPEYAAKFSRRKLLTAFNSVCLTVAFAHDRGVIHRDVTPANIMLGDFGETYVIDWGLAKYIDVPEAEGDRGNVVATRGGVIIGTPGYVAPEQIAGDPDSIGPLADVYGLGAVLFEILTLEPLHTQTSRDDIIRSTMEGADARASLRFPDAEVPPELEAACVRATQFVPSARFRSARELSETLERFLDGDRDLSLRSGLAERHAEAAEEAVRRAAEGPVAEEEEFRRQAMQELGRCLALDPNNARAMKSMVQLLLEPPREMPQEAKAQLGRARERHDRHAERWAAVAYLACLVALPLLMWMGVEDWTFFGMSLAAILSLAGFSFVSSRMKERRGWVLHARVMFGMLGALFAAQLFGPLFLLPTLVLASSFAFALRPGRAFRIFTMLLASVAIVLPVIFEWSGWVAPSYLFSEGMFCLLPNAVRFRSVPAVSVLTLLHVGLVWIIGIYVGKVRDALSASEERFHLYNWHLRQLLPRDSSTPPRGEGTRPS